MFFENKKSRSTSHWPVRELFELAALCGGVGCLSQSNRPNPRTLSDQISRHSACNGVPCLFSVELYSLGYIDLLVLKGDVFCILAFSMATASTGEGILMSARRRGYRSRAPKFVRTIHSPLRYEKTKIRAKGGARLLHLSRYPLHA